jgi:hypothetical protein
VLAGRRSKRALHDGSAATHNMYARSIGARRHNPSIGTTLA